MAEEQEATRNKDQRPPQTEPSTQTAPAPGVAQPADAQRFAVQPEEQEEPDREG